METRIIILFCVIDDYLKATNFKDDIQIKMSTSEIMTVALAASIFFGGNHEKSRSFFKDHRYVKFMISKSQFNRRLHAVPVYVWENLQKILAEVFKRNNDSKEYVVDSFPVTVCHNIRISSCKIYREKQYRGYSASKRQYFYGIRVHMICTTKREPIEIIFEPGSTSDIKAFKAFDLDLPENSTIFGDAGYNDYEYEDILQDDGMSLLTSRKSNSKRPRLPYIEYMIQSGRKIVETCFSVITKDFPKKIHAVTARGFELKVFSFILAYSMSFLKVTT